MLWQSVVVIITLFGLCSSRHLSLDSNRSDPKSFADYNPPRIERATFTFPAEKKHMSETSERISEFVGEEADAEVSYHRFSGLRFSLAGVPSSLNSSNQNIPVLASSASDTESTEFKKIQENATQATTVIVEDSAPSDESEGFKSSAIPMNDATSNPERVRPINYDGQSDISVSKPASSGSNESGFTSFDTTATPFHEEQTIVIRTQTEVNQYSSRGLVRTIADKTNSSLNNEENELPSNYELMKATGDKLPLKSEDQNDSGIAANSSFTEQPIGPKEESSSVKTLKINLPTDPIERKCGVESSTEPKHTLEHMKSSDSSLATLSRVDSNIQQSPSFAMKSTAALQNDLNEHQAADIFAETAEEVIVRRTFETARPKDVQPPDQAIEDLIEQVIETLNAPKEVEELLERAIEESFSTLSKAGSQTVSQDTPIEESSRNTGSLDANNTAISNEISNNLSVVKEPIASPMIQVVAERKDSTRTQNATENSIEHDSTSLSDPILIASEETGAANTIGPLSEKNIFNLSALDTRDYTVHIVKKANPEINSHPTPSEVDATAIENISHITAEPLSSSNQDEHINDQVNHGIESTDDATLRQDTITIENKNTVSNHPLINESIDTLAQTEDTNDGVDEKFAIEPLSPRSTIEVDLQKNEITKADVLINSENEYSSGMKILENRDSTLSPAQVEHTTKGELAADNILTESYEAISTPFEAQDELNSNYVLNLDEFESDNAAHGASKNDSLPFLVKEIRHGQADDKANIGQLTRLENPTHSFLKENELNIPFNYENLGRDLNLPQIGESIVRKDFSKPIFQGRSMLSEELIVPQSYQIKPSAFRPTKVEFDSVNLSVEDLIESPANLARSESDRPINPDASNSNLADAIVEAAELTTEINRIILAFHSSMASDGELPVSRTSTPRASMDSRLVEPRFLASDYQDHIQIASVNLTVIIVLSVGTLFLIVALLLVFGVKIRNHHGTLNIEMTEQQVNAHVSVPVVTENS